MSLNPAVSAIIIFLNEEKFLGEAIESVIAQTSTDWELLLVDDGSTDESPRIAEDYSNRYPGKIKYLTHPENQNRGMSASRNLGIKHARGTFISFLDGDDVWRTNKIERQVQLLRENPEAVMAYGQIELWYSWTGEPDDLNRDLQYGLVAPGFQLDPNRTLQPPELLRLFLKYKHLIPTGIMIKKDTVLELGGYEEQFKGNYEDAVFLAKLCMSHPVYVSDECWYRYRQHPQSFTKQQREAGTSEQTQAVFLDWIEAFFKEEGVTDPSLWKSIKAARRTVNFPRFYALLKKLRILNGVIRNKLLKP